MRPIGRLPDEVQARQFGDYLYGKGIENQIDPVSPGGWEVWILDDIHMDSAKTLLDRFRHNPDDPAFAQVPRVAVRQRPQDQAAQIPKRARTIDAGMIFYTPPVPLGPLSVALIAISIMVTLLANFSGNDRFKQTISITEFQTINGEYVDPQGKLPEVWRGQVWRLFTPMFLHFDVLHILFNMLWLRDLGSMIEARRNSWLLLLLTLVLGGLSNLAEFLVSGPSFGGMSGVVYGLLGYIWMQGKFNPASKLSLQPQTVTFMIVWFVVCLSGLVGPIANTAHAVGLAVGVGWGFMDARMRVALHHY